MSPGLPRYDKNVGIQEDRVYRGWRRNLLCPSPINFVQEFVNIFVAGKTATQFHGILSWFDFLARGEIGKRRPGNPFAARFAYLHRRFARRWTLLLFPLFGHSRHPLTRYRLRPILIGRCSAIASIVASTASAKRSPSAGRMLSYHARVSSKSSLASGIQTTGEVTAS